MGQDRSPGWIFGNATAQKSVRSSQLLLVHFFVIHMVFTADV